MDIRILTLLVLISVAGSMADLRSPLLRIRRNGLQESGRSRVVEFVGMPRAKRESPTAESTTKSTATPTSTSDPPTTAPATLSTDPIMTSTKKPDPTTRSAPNSYPTTSSTPDSSSTTPKPRPSTGSTSKSVPTTSPTTSRPTSASTASPKAATTTTSTTPRKPSDSGKSKKPGSSTASPMIGSRINPSMDEPEESDAKPEPKADTQPGPSEGSPSYSGFPNAPFPPFFMPSFVPEVSFPYHPYGDPTFNSIPGPSNYAWTGTNNGPGAATSFASASAGGFGGSGYDKTPSVADRGAFVDNAPSAANLPGVSNVPNVPNVPNVVSAGGYGNNGGGMGFEPNSFVFPGYNLDAFQRQMEDHFRQLQAQFQQQQQAIFAAANRVGTDGYPGSSSGLGGHSAVSSINLGPGGGYQAGAINPAAPGIASRFAEDIPPPSGNSYGVFAGSSSKTVIGPDGKPVSHKISTTGVNDNGKITFRTVED